MSLPEFPSSETYRRFWWLHDSFWHAALVREYGPAEANRLNLLATEKTFHMLTLTLLREKVIRRPESIQDLMYIFRVVWQNAFFDDLYVHEPVEYRANKAVWTGLRCHAHTALTRAGLLEGYACGCQALRNGVMKALRLKPLHVIKESLIRGDRRCVIEITFEPRAHTPGTHPAARQRS